MLKTVESTKLNYEVPILRNFRPNNLLHTCFQAMFLSTQQTINALSDEVIDNNRDINASKIEQLLESVPPRSQPLLMNVIFVKDPSLVTTVGQFIYIIVKRRIF